MRAVLFDFDGVLVNSEPIHYRALRDSLRPEGLEIGETEYLSSYLSYTDREAIRLAFERNGLPFDRERIEAVARRKAALYGALMAEIPFFPGAKGLVVELQRQVPVGIASGARRAEIEAILTAAGLRHAFSAIVGAEDVRHGKPHPEPYLTAMGQLAPRAPDLHPEQCLVFEDSIAGIASARAAGMKVVAVAHSYPAARLAGAHRVIESLAAIHDGDLPALFGS
jgi:beta-phosphoglucomutase